MGGQLGYFLTRALKAAIIIDERNGMVCFDLVERGDRAAHPFPSRIAIICLVGNLRQGVDLLHQRIHLTRIDGECLVCRSHRRFMIAGVVLGSIYAIGAIGITLG